MKTEPWTLEWDDLMSDPLLNSFKCEGALDPHEIKCQRIRKTAYQGVIRKSA